MLNAQVHELESQLREADLSAKHGSQAAQTASHEAKLEVRQALIYQGAKGFFD